MENRALLVPFVEFGFDRDDIGPKRASPHDGGALHEAGHHHCHIHTHVQIGWVNHFVE